MKFTTIQNIQCSIMLRANIQVATIPTAVVKASPIGIGESVKLFNMYQIITKMANRAIPTPTASLGVR